MSVEIDSVLRPEARAAKTMLGFVLAVALFCGLGFLIERIGARTKFREMGYHVSYVDRKLTQTDDTITSSESDCNR